jgi:5-methylcytosine-specific restriction endonuclease McrA
MIDLKTIKKAVLIRDNYTCFICKKKSLSNHVHHIIPFQKSNDNAKTNLITLCNVCHKKTENKFCRYGLTHFLDQMITHSRYRE